MNKLSFCISLLLINISACSVTPNTENSNLHVAEVTAEKPQKHRHKKSPEGVISVDIVNNKNQLHLLTGKLKQGQKSLWYQLSKDGGKSWSAESKVLNADKLAIKMTRGNDAQIAVQANNIVVSWTKFDPKARFKAGAMQAARSTDAGKTWQYTNTPPDWKKGPHGYIDMAADEHAMHAVWLDSRFGSTGINATQGIHYAKSIDGGQNWQSNKTLDKISCSCCWNTVKTDFDGNPYVLYRDKQPSDFSIGVIKQQWQRLNHVGAFNWQFDGCPHIGAGLDFQNTAGHKRTHAIVGTGHLDHLGVHYLYSDDAGKNWSKAMQLGTESAIHADIAAHDNGRVVAVWDMMTADGLAIFSAESKDQGNNWSDAIQISKPKIRATHPRIVKTRQGFLALWTENDGQQLLLTTLLI